MFSCARVRENLIIQVNFKRALICVFSTLFILAFLLWIAWIVVVKIEARRLREEIYQNMSGAVATAVQQSFDKNHASLLKLEDCQARLKHTDAVSSDLAKMVNKKILEGSEEVELAEKPAKHKPK